MEEEGRCIMEAVVEVVEEVDLRIEGRGACILVVVGVEVEDEEERRVHRRGGPGVDIPFMEVVGEGGRG